MTPPGFRFSCKVPREISHERRLRDCGDLLGDFLRGVEPLGDKLACLLVQTPPWLEPNRVAIERALPPLQVRQRR